MLIHVDLNNDLNWKHHFCNWLALQKRCVYTDKLGMVQVFDADHLALGQEFNTDPLALVQVFNADHLAVVQVFNADHLALRQVFNTVGLQV